MKKISCFLIMLFMVGTTTLWAQSNGTPPSNDKFENLTLKSSPAFVVLGVEPTNIDRPSSPTKLASSLQNAVVDGKLQPNIAIDINPYLLFKTQQPIANRLDASEFMFERKDVFTTFARTMTLSYATSPTDNAVFGKLQGTGIGVGLHGQFINGRPSTLLKNWWDTRMKWLLVTMIHSAVTTAGATNIPDLAPVIDREIATFKKVTLPSQPFNTLTNGELDEFCKDLKTKMVAFILLNGDAKTTLDAQLQAIETKYATDEQNALAAANAAKNPLAKQGFILDFAIGNAFVIDQGNDNTATNGKTAFWLTPSYRWDVSKGGKNISLLDVMGVVRYTINNTSAEIDVANYVDIGTKGAYTREKWSVSVEGVYRRASNKPNGQDRAYTYRATIGASYKLTDAFTLTFNFGTNFDGNTTTYTDAKKLFAVGGLNLGLPFINTGK